MRIDTRKIETILADRNMSKTAYAAAAGVSRQSISTILTRGTCEPKTAGKLAHGLGISVSEIADSRS